ncbi:MAG TPA: molybdate ABC transporter substrate-binding protein [Verrucomicrobiae bacterium]
MRKISKCLALVWCFFLCFTLVAKAETVLVFAAASLTDSLKVAAKQYEEKSGDKIEFNFAASSLLARQIEEGAPADIFFSADSQWMDELEKRGLIIPRTRMNRLSNTLVIVVPKDGAAWIKSPSDLSGAQLRRLALADPKLVPAGIYAREYLEKEKLWTALEPKVIPTANVRAALAAVASGNVDAGIVYKTDAAISKQVTVAYEIPSSEGPEIVYPVAEVKGNGKPSAKAFLDYLKSLAASAVFAKFGFIVKNSSQ